MDEPPTVMVDVILLALKTGAKTEAEAIAECGELAKHHLLDFDYLRQKNEALYQKVMQRCREHPLD